MCAPKEVEAPVILAAGVYLPQRNHCAEGIIQRSILRPGHFTGNKNLQDGPRNVQKLGRATRDGLLRSERGFWANRQILAHLVERPGQ
jgi:hypothetical protein